MNKKLLVLALAGAFVAPAAMADVTISGTVNVGVTTGRITDASTAGSNAVQSANGSLTGFSNMGMTSNYSNININSTEDIGDGNKVVLNVQLGVDNNGTNITATPGGSSLNEVGRGVTQRNTYIGFEGGWGSLRLGINEHIYERYMYQSDFLDGAAGIGGNLQMLGTPGYGGVFDVGTNGCGPNSGCAGFYRRVGNSVWYDSPDINGFTFGIAQSFNAYQGSASGPKPMITSMGAQYKPADMPFFANIAYQRHSDLFGLNFITGAGNATSSRDTGLQIGGGVTFGDFQFNARWETLKYESSGDATFNSTQVTEYKRDAIWVGAKYTVSTGYFTVQVGMANDGKVQCGASFAGSCNANDSGATMFTGGYAHNLSKQTQLLFFGSITNNDPMASYFNIGGPFIGNTPGTRRAGADGRSIALLIKHSF